MSPGSTRSNKPTKDIPGFEGVPLNGDAAKAAEDDRAHRGIG